jgi:sec-independent protein translocase protein TatA
MSVSLPNLPLALFNMSMMELVIVFVIILLLFGAKRLPDLANSLGRSISEFKKASREAENEIRQAATEDKPKSPAAAKPTTNQPPSQN